MYRPLFRIPPRPMSADWLGSVSEFEIFYLLLKWLFFIYYYLDCPVKEIWWCIEGMLKYVYSNVNHLQKWLVKLSYIHSFKAKDILKTCFFSFTLHILSLILLSRWDTYLWSWRNALQLCTQACRNHISLKENVFARRASWRPNEHHATWL